LTACRFSLILNRVVEYSHEPLDVIFAALSDPTRRAILAALGKRPATVSEIARPFPVSLNAISKHLMVLESAGLIHREKVGREHRCSLEAAPLQRATLWLECYRQFWEVRLEALERHVLSNKKQRQ
jgi:DNA-binding transcriptional ArsR family regulator